MRTNRSLLLGFLLMAAINALGQGDKVTVVGTISDTSGAVLPGAEVVLTRTREQPAAWTGFARRVDREMLAQVAWPTDRLPIAFLCGPTTFVEAAADLLVELGHDAARIKTERFGPTGG